MVKLVTSISPMVKLAPAWNSSRFGTQSPQGMHGRGQARNIHRDLDAVARLGQHRQPGDVIAVLVRDQDRGEGLGRNADPSRRSKVSLRLRPASIRRRVRSVATRVAFPELDDASTQPFTI